MIFKFLDFFLDNYEAMFKDNVLRIKIFEYSTLQVF